MKPYKTLKIVNKNKYAEMYYRRALSDETERLIKAIFKDIDKEYITIYTSNAGSINKMQALFKKYKGKYLDIFLKNCEKIIKKWFKISSSQSIRSMKEVYKKALGRNVIIKYDKIYDDVLKLVIQRNVGLIQNTTLQTLNNIENIVYDGITTGQGLKTVEKDLNKQEHISSDRIKRIARDQTAKANSALNQLSQQSAGIEFFEWDTAQDERVSTGYGGHKELQGKIYKWGDVEHYPIIDSYGHRGLPAQRVNCRCTALAVVLTDDYEAKRLSDGSYKIIKGRLS